MSWTGDKWVTSGVKSSPHLGQNKLSSKIHTLHARSRTITHINQSIYQQISSRVNADGFVDRSSFTVLHGEMTLIKPKNVPFAWTASGAVTYTTHCKKGDVLVPHYDINRCTFPWNFIVIRDQEAWTLSTPTAAPTYLEWILRSNSGTGPVQYVLCEPTWPIKGSVHDRERVIGFEVRRE